MEFEAERSVALISAEGRLLSKIFKKNMSKIVPEVTLIFTVEMFVGEELLKLITYTE